VHIKKEKEEIMYEGICAIKERILLWDMQ